MIEETLRRLGASDDVDEMLAEFLEYYEANIARESRPFPGASPRLSASPPKAQRSRSAPTSRNASAAFFSKGLISKTISRRSRDLTLSWYQNRIPVISLTPSRLPAAIRHALS
jgi:hypothetical protein